MEHIKEQLLHTVTEIVNAIAHDTYEKLETLVELSENWQGENGDTAIKDLRQLITTNYNGWAEDEGKPYIIDTFTEENCSEDWETVAEELQNTGTGSMTYDLMTTDRDLDYFWLEFDFTLTNDNRITTTLDINF